MKKNWLFYLSYFCLIISFMFENVLFIKNIIEYIEIIGFLLATILIINNLKKFTKHDFIYYVVIYAIVLISTIVSHDKTIFKLFFMLLMLKEYDFNSIVKYDFACRLVCFFVVIILYFLGLTEVYISYRESRIRYSYGFGHANMFAYLILLLNIEYAYIGKKSNPLLHIILAIVSFLTIWYCADSRSSIFIFAVVYFIYIFYDKIKFEKIFNNKLIKFVSANLFIILTIVSGILTYLYYKQYPVSITINAFLSDRLRYILLFVKDYSITLFGNAVTFVSSYNAKLNHLHTLVLDNGFYYIIIRYGLIIFLTVAYYVRKAILKAIKDKDYMLLSILLLMIIYSVTENYFFKVNYSVFIFSLAPVFMNKRGR